MAKFEKKDLKKKSENTADWYNDIVLRSGLADYGPVRGTMVIRPYGYAVWENIQNVMNKMFKSGGSKNGYFPLFIPYSLLEKEKEHVDGFSPELALVTHAGGEKLAEPLVVRPTSETVMYEMYGKWIKSWRDLPMVINQWNNVVRWEKRTYFFLRTSEFLWQEGHGAHATNEESQDLVMKALGWYATTYRDHLAIEVVEGEKSAKERFAGADSTYTVEALMPDGKALQGGTSHNLGQNFSKAQNISFQDKEGKNEFAWQNSWGFSTRSLGALFLTHGDDNGLVMPPKVAPIKAVIIPILGKQDEKVLKYASKVKEELSQNSEFPGDIEIWDDAEKSMGWKINEAEIKGIPVRIVVGSREMEERTVEMSFRFTDFDKKMAKCEGLHEVLEEMFLSIQKAMYEKSKRHLEENTFEVETYEEFKKVMETTRGFIRAFWCEDEKCEVKIKEETKASTRAKKLGEKEEKGKCVYCGKEAKFRWYFAQAY